MRLLILLGAVALAPCTASAQDNMGSINQSMQSDTSSSTTSTRSGTDSSSMSDPPDNQGSAEMRDWIKSNSSSTSSSSSSGVGVGFDKDNDNNDDDQPRWSKHKPSRPRPEQIDGTYRISAQNGPFLCTVRLTSNAYFGGYFATTSTGCPQLWKVSRWELDGSSIALTNASGEVYATFWPKDRDVWVGRSFSTGERLSLSR